jgi:hypothetical protein
MMRKKLTQTFMLLFMGCMFVQIAVAETKWQETYEYVSKIQVSEDNHLRINVLGNFSVNHGCNERWWATSKMSLDHAQTKAILQIALSSFLWHKPIRVHTVCENPNGYPILTEIQIQEVGPTSGSNPPPSDPPGICDNDPNPDECRCIRDPNCIPD